MNHELSSWAMGSTRRFLPPGELMRTVAGYLLRIAANMFKFGPSLLGQLQDCDTVLETMQLHYRTGCSVWSDSCYVPIINISYGNDTKVFHFPFTTNFFSIVMSIGVVASLCLLLLLLSAVRLRKQFIYSKYHR